MAIQPSRGMNAALTAARPLLVTLHRLLEKYNLQFRLAEIKDFPLAVDKKNL